MSARAAVNSWGQWVGYCTECTETTTGNRSSVHLWADAHDHDPLERYYRDPVGLELVQAILDRKAGRIWGDEDDPWTQEELRLAAERNKEHHRRIGLTD